MVGSGAIAALAGVSFSRPDGQVLVQLLSGAAISGLAYLILAGGFIMRAKIYRELRNRVVILSLGIVEIVKERTRSRLAS